MTEKSLLQRLSASLFPSTEAPAAPTPVPAQSQPCWHPLPGNLIELGNSGFQILLDVRPNRPLYTLHAPEGWVIAWGGDLAGLKLLGERYARERLEFVFTKKGWKP